MNDKLIECVPNFSEGRDSRVIEAIRDSILDGGDCEIWDYSADADHNRSVFTLAASPEAMKETVLRFTKKAAELIDMREHTGVHPCIGAADVIPFIPLRNTSMEECIDLSEIVGLRIANELELPVYLYARSAKRPEHLRLADIRRGGYAALRREIGQIPGRAPDYGPLSLGSAGGVSIGARDFLIAFNVYLDTDDVSDAKQIARKIRTSSGGLPFLQAIGLPVNGRAQVSMNLLNYRVTSMKTVFQAIEQEAQKLGVLPVSSELIGMLPRAALEGTSAEELLLYDFDSSRILETHMA
ncbi:MAG: glutamate formimidoyltransferase [Flexilinea sp.]|nr:glutamate formimidoyltransferase [Flexilinea sp.]